MKLIHFGPGGGGFFGVGQFTSGVIAFGQFATGVIAIGQFASGVVAIGQFSFGLVWNIGMFSAGMLQTTAMFGIGGRRGAGGVIQLIPSVGKPRVTPNAISAVEALATSGWVETTIERDNEGFPMLMVNGKSLPVKIDRRLVGGALLLSDQKSGPVFARLERFGAVSVCTRIVRVPEPPHKSQNFKILAPLQFIAYVALAVAWWIFVGHPLVDSLSRG